jgi:hypothetical protein
MPAACRRAGVLGRARSDPPTAGCCAGASPDPWRPPQTQMARCANGEDQSPPGGSAGAKRHTPSAPVTARAAETVNVNGRGGGLRQPARYSKLMVWRCRERQARSYCAAVTTRKRWLSLRASSHSTNASKLSGRLPGAAGWVAWSWWDSSRRGGRTPEAQGTARDRARHAHAAGGFAAERKAVTRARRGSKSSRRRSCAGKRRRPHRLSGRSD